VDDDVLPRSLEESAFGFLAGPIGFTANLLVQPFKGVRSPIDSRT
jgi:hypothetical protein